MKKALDYLTAKPARFFFLAALLWGGLMCYLNTKDGPNFHWHDLLVEANGMVFDLLVFGILLSVYETLREKKGKIERLYEEIDDYRGWDEKEAMFRIVGAVRRLNKLGVSDINLTACFLVRAYLISAKLDGASLWRANLEEAKLVAAKLQGANLWIANFRRADLKSANLMGANLVWANLEAADLRKANLMGADLEAANLIGANLEAVEVDRDWFEKLEKWETKGREEIKEKYLIDEKGVLRIK